MSGSQFINIVDVIRHSFRHLNPYLIDHGERVAYILMKMLQDTTFYSKQEKQDIFMLGLLHDIGAYKKEEIDSMLSLDMDDSVEHSIFGYLLFRTFSPLADYADVILYHHHCNAQYYPAPINNYHRDIAKLIYLADRIDIFCTLNNTSELGTFFEHYSDSIFSPFLIRWFHETNGRFRLLEQTRSGEYQEELASYIRNNFFLSEEQSHDYLMTFIFSVDFRNEFTALHTSYALHISKNIADALHLPPTICKTIQLAVLLHNIGKISIPSLLTSSDDYDRYMQDLYRGSTLDITREILSGAVDSKILHTIEDSFALLECWSNNRPVHEVPSPATEIVALSYLISNRLTADLNVSLRHYPKLLAHLRKKYQECQMDDTILIALEKNFDEITKKTQDSCTQVLHTYQHMMDEHSYLNTLILHYNHYNSKYHPSTSIR